MKSFFESNLSLLSALDPALAERMRSLAWPQAGLHVFESRNGHPSLKAVSHDGVEILIHSEYDPAREASQFFDRRELIRHDAYLFNGFGLGYMALEAVRRLDSRRWVACVEAHEGLFRAALECMDLSPLLVRPRIGFFVGREWGSFQRWLKGFLDTSMAMDLTVIPYPPCARVVPAFYSAVTKEVEVGANYRMMDWQTLINVGRTIEQNSIRNLVALSRSNGVQGFHNLFSGVPAIVVGAGPSLNSAIPHLRRSRGRAVIVAVGRATARLLQEEIVPDFVVTIDWSEKIMPCLSGLAIPPEVVHLFDSDCYFGVATSFRGRNVSFESGNEFGRWSRAFLGDRGVLERGNTVAHCAFQFARHMGCHPILFTGVDLAFPGEKTHAEGVPQTWGGKTEDQNMTWVMVPGTQGRPVRSDTSFSAYITGFEAQIAKSGASVIQTSEIGAMIRGADHMSLSEAVDRFLSREVPTGKHIQEALSKAPTFNFAVFEDSVKWLLEGLDRITKITESAEHALSQIRRMDHTNRQDMPKILKKLEKVKSEEDQILRDRDMFPFFSRITGRADQEIRLLNREVEKLSIDDPQRLRDYTKIFEVSFSAFREGAQFLRSEIESVREQIRREHQPRSDERVNSTPS